MDEPPPVPLAEAQSQRALAAVRASAARLLILRWLHAQPAYQSNDALLCGALEHLGVPLGADECVAHLRWLHAQKLIELCEIEATCGVHATARLTLRGAEVAHGIVQIDGVARPAPA